MFSVHKDEEEVVNELKTLIEKIARESIEERGRFFVGFSGGSLGKYLCQVLPSLETSWDKWTVFFCDERYVPENDSESTYGFYKANLIPKVPLTKEQFISINVNDPIEKVALDYESTIREKFNCAAGIPNFDLLLLGVGPDGHTASLFPDHDLLGEKDRLITYLTDSPKPPPARITMTFPLINNSFYSIFAVPGKGKADIITKIFSEKQDLPAGAVKALKKVYWLLDEESAALL